MQFIGIIKAYKTTFSVAKIILNTDKGHFSYVFLSLKGDFLNSNAKNRRSNVTNMD